MTIYSGDVIHDLKIRTTKANAKVPDLDLSTIRGGFLDSLTAVRLKTSHKNRLESKKMGPTPDFPGQTENELHPAKVGENGLNCPQEVIYSPKKCRKRGYQGFAESFEANQID